MRIFLALFFGLVGCKSLLGPESETLSTTQPFKACRDVCGHRVENPQILGCVTSCDMWSTRKVKILVGGAKDKSREPEPSCDLYYELRELKDVGETSPVSWRQAFGFGFRHSKGLEDSGYLSFSTGLDSATRLVDFTKQESRRTIQRDFTGSNIIALFQRKDSSRASLPTFSATEANVDTTKSVVVVLDEKFDPRNPFSSIRFVRYQESRKGALIHDFECSE